MAKYKFVMGSYDPDTGLSYVQIANRLGNFDAICQLRDEDKGERESKFFGCQVAEGRAILKMLKTQLKDYRSQYKALKDYYNVLHGAWSYDQNDWHVRKLVEMKMALADKIICTKDEIAKIRNTISELIKTRDEYFKKKEGNAE